MLALINAVLYCCILPLWEGFDEPFHYGYVEYLCTRARFAEVNRTSVPAEIRASLRLTPVSWILHNALPGSIAFDDWFRLPAEKRRERRAAVAALPPGLQRKDSDLLNYEAQQAPLAYVLLAPLNSAMSGIELPTRILALRLCATTGSTLFLFYAARSLVEALGLRGAFRLAALACMFESQMLWGSIAHIGNDWLAIPLSVVFFALLILVIRATDWKYTVGLGAALAAGLVTKAYFLAFVPVFVAVVIRQMLAGRFRRRTALAAGIALLAAPWYVRNWITYRSFSGTQESIAGIGFMQAPHAFFHINWLTSTIGLFRWALWTGNWSFVAFSRLTLNAEMMVAAAGFMLLLTRAREITPVERWVLLGCTAFFAGLVYQTCVTWAASGGAARNAEPWYLQCILPALWALVFLGFQRSGVIGRMLAILLAAISAWIAVATYSMKLIPYYGGFRGRSTIPAVLAWWRHLQLEALSVTMLGPVTLTFAALAIFLILLAGTTVMLVCGLGRMREGTLN